VTNDEDLFARAMMQHDGGLAFWPHGKPFEIPIFAGWNFRASEIQGAILRVQLRKIDALLRRTRSHRARIVEAVSAHPILRSIKYNDAAGDCGTIAGLRFRSEGAAREFMARLGERGVPSWTPIDSGRHVYSNWEAIMERRGSYHRRLDAFRHPANRRSKAEYRPDTCPRTLEILSSTVFLDVRPEWTAAEVKRRIRATESAGSAST
jgi:dTDP-4-amino-4,6-dideoxygalactose transaminase